MDEGKAEAPFLERWGLEVLRAGGEARASTPANPVHVLDEAEQRALAGVERGAVARAALVGALSALASGITEALAGVHFRLDRGPSVRELAAFAGLYGLVTIVASVIEIAYLYWDALRSVRTLAVSAGLDLAPSTRDSHVVGAALARAALELPETSEPVFGVDPRREAHRGMLFAASILYKLKIGLSSFVFKAIVRRALGRLATRQLLAFAAVPVNALWNAAVTFLVMREARIRVMGPSAVLALMPTLVPPGVSLSLDARKAIVRAAASSIVKSQTAHPNLVAFLRQVLESVGPFEESFVLDDTKLFLEHFRALSESERTIVLRVLVLAALLDGRIVRNERRHLEEAFAAAGKSLPIDALEEARRSFVRGRPIRLDPLVA